MGNVDHSSTGSEVLHSGEIAAMSSKFAEGYARVREVTDSDSACPAWAKAMYMAGAAAVRGQMDLLNREIVRSRDLGLKLSDARGAALAVLISRGEGVYKKFTAAVNTAFESEITLSDEEVPEYEIDRQGALDYFTSYFGFVPDYIELMADEAPRALEGYVLMREWSLAENTLDAKHVELLLCTINAAEFSSRFVNVHANGARNAGATEAEIVESVICAIPVSGVASWLPGADGIMEGR
ncbi:MAG: carboxymuconolactone decarboxylase family protein [Actinomycetota bacterium]|nr:carboxymuconolactone decarboxylase family protein [Actinomycetota bacterium]